MIFVTVKTQNGQKHSAVGVVVSCYGWVNLYDAGQVVAKGNSLNHAIQLYIQSLTNQQHEHSAHN
jgi:hypothetical protein